MSPYGGTTPEEDEKIDRCVDSLVGKKVNKRTGKPFTKEEAIPVCKASVLGEDEDKSENAEWTTEYVNNLPDSSFAWIEPGGEKDEEGKTVPRTLRHLPYKDENGKVDLPHVRNALARLDQVKNMPDYVKARVRKMLEDILARETDGEDKEENQAEDEEDDEDEDKMPPDEDEDEEDEVTNAPRPDDIFTLSMNVAQNVELVEDEKDYSMFKFELIDNKEYNGVHFTVNGVKHQHDEFHSHDFVIPHGLDHSQKTLDQLGQVVDMMLVEEGEDVRAFIISKIFKETDAQKQAQILFRQGNLNYISGGWSGKLSYNGELDRFEFNNPKSTCRKAGIFKIKTVKLLMFLKIQFFQKLT